MDFVFNEEDARARKAARDKEIAGTIGNRLSAGLQNSWINAWNAPANVANAIEKLAGTPQTDFGRIERVSTPEAETAGQKVADLAGRLAGEVSFGMGLGSAMSAAGTAGKAASGITNLLTKSGLGGKAATAAGRIGGSFAENMAVDVVQDVSRGLANESSAGEIAKELGTSAAFNVGVAGLLEGLPAIVRARKAAKATKEATAKAAKEATETAAKETAEAVNKQVLDSINAPVNLPKIADDAIPTRVADVPASAAPDIPTNVPTKTVGAAPARMADVPELDIPTAQPVKASSVEDVVSTIGERKAYNNAYNAMNDVPTGSVDVNGVKMGAREYVDAVEATLPDSVEELTELADAFAKQAEEVSSGSLKVNLQLCGHAAERKLEWLKLAEIPEGTKVRGFVQKRLLGEDEISSPEFLDALSGKADTYTPKADVELDKAASALINTPEKTNDLYNKLMKMTGDELITDTEVAASKKMISDFVKQGDFDKAVDLTDAVSRSGTATGRALRQYAMKKLTDPVDLVAASRNFLKKHNIELSEETKEVLKELSEQLGKHAEGTAEFGEIVQQIYRTLGDQVPVKKLEILASWRKLAMLANPKTQLRNVVSNVAYIPLRKMDEAVASVVERLLPHAENTQSLGWSFRNPGIVDAVDGATKRAASEMSNYGKWGISDQFSRHAILRTRNPFGKSKAAKMLNKVAELNNKGLEWGDQVFFDRTFRDSLGQFMTARGLTEATQEATDHALKRALEATYRADNVINDVIRNLTNHKNSTIRTAADLLVPFTKTPSNLLVQAYRHSPANLAVSSAQLVKDIVTKGGATKATADIINDFAKGITGTALMAVGLYLGGSGILDVNYRSGSKQRAVDEIEGQQQFSIRIGDKTISVDWLEPVAAPFLAGATVASALAKQDLSDDDNPKTIINVADGLWTAMMSGYDSIFEMSFLQTIRDVMGESTVEGMGQRFLSNAVSQHIPTVLGQAARSVDPIQRRTRADTMPESIWNSVLAKIPGASKTLPAELDMFGQEVRRGNIDNVWANVFQQFISPPNVRQKAYAGDPAVQEMLDVYRDTGTTAIPSAASTPELEAEVGQSQYRALMELVSNPNKRHAVQVTTVLANGKERRRTVNKRWDEMTQEERARILSRIFRNAKTEVEGD